MTEKIKPSKSGPIPDVKKQSILPGDLVVFDAARFNSDHTRTGYIINSDGCSVGGRMGMNDIFLYVGRCPPSCDGPKDLVIVGEQKLYVWNLLPELKKYNG